MDVQEELNGVLYWIAALLILLLQWLYPRVPQSHVLSRMFYDHLTLLCDLTYWVPTLFISLLYCMLWGFGLSVQMHGKPFPVWGSHNKSAASCLNAWRTSFSCSLYQGYHFFSLKDGNCKPLQPSYTKGSSWLPFISKSVTLCARATWAILNHTPIGEFRQCFFPTECTQCLYGYCQVETYQHIFANCC